MKIKINKIKNMYAAQEMYLKTGERDNNAEKKVLLHTITPTELKCLKNELNKKGFTTRVYKTNALICEEVLGIGKTQVFITQSQAGSIGSASIMNVMNKAKEILNPNVSIMGGIAFGFNQKKEELGDIVISRQVWNYETAKLSGNDFISRGDKITASSMLLESFTFSSSNWTNSKVHFGVYASGEKLVNDSHFCSQLLKAEPELMAGDMEAYGFSSVCYNQGLDWIVVKGISDWGINKTDFSQEIAASNSWGLIIHTLEEYLV